MFRTHCISSQRDAYSGCDLSGAAKTDLPSTCRVTTPLFMSRVGGQKKQTDAADGWIYAGDVVNWEVE